MFQCDAAQKDFGAIIRAAGVAHGQPKVVLSWDTDGETMKNPARVAVFGMGYVGCVSAACLAELGHQVTGIDCDVHKVSSLREGRAPFYEPGLEALVKSNVNAGRLTSCETAAQGLAQTDIALLCVGTPS